MSVLACGLALSVAACGGGSDGDAIATASAATGSTMKALDAGTTADATLSWTACANEGGTCAFSGTQQVRYGTPTQYVVQTVTGGTPCTNAVFGDPAYGIAKSCSHAPVPADVAGVTWVSCASEGGTCSFSGTRQVRYGTLAQNVIASFTAQTPCTNAVFGDPAFGTAKSCWYANTAAAMPVTDTWTPCANEGGTCSFSGTRQVQYGTATQYTTASYTDGIACTNAVFGDPAVGQTKNCRYASSSTTVSTPSAPGATPITGASGTNPPVVFNASASGRAGDVVTLQGENFGSAPSVYFDGAAGTPLTIVNQIGTGWLAVQIPASAPAALVLRIGNGTGVSAQVALNAARPLHLDTLQLTPGGAFRVFGRNLLLAGSSPKLTVGGVSATIDLAHSDEYMLTATAPATLTASTAAAIVVDNGNGTGPATLDRSVQTLASGSGDPYGLGVGWAAAYTPLTKTTVNAATDSRLAQRTTCDGSTDDAPAIQAAIDLAAGNGGGTVVLPAGSCRLVGRMSLRSNVVVQGAGKTATVLTYDADYPFLAAGIDLAGVRNLTLVNSGASGEGPQLKDSTRVVLQNLRIVLNTSRQMYLSGNHQFAFQGSDIVQTSGISDQGPYTLQDSAGLLFENNTTQWATGAPTFGRIHDAYVHANHFTRDGRAQNLGSTVHALTLDFAYRVAVLGNTFDVAYGPITNKTRNDGETILTEGGGAARTENLGNVAGADATSISDPANTINVDPFGTGTIPEDYGVVIVGGKGAGQTRRVTAYSQPKITVDRAWDVIPDSTSRYATFVYGLEKALIKDNVLSQNPRGVWLYHTAIREVDVIGNSISEGGGIYLRSYQNLATKSFMPIYNVLIARNTIVNTTQQWGSYINSVFVNADAQSFGIATLGVEMRSNQMTTNQPNLNSAYEEYAGTEGYMNMMRLESGNPYVSSTMPRLLGTILANNACTHCAVGVRVGTGAGGTTILGSKWVDVGQATDDWATAGTAEKSVGTVVR